MKVGSERISIEGARKNQRSYPLSARGDMNGMTTTHAAKAIFRLMGVIPASIRALLKDGGHAILSRMPKRSPANGRQRVLRRRAPVGEPPGQHMRTHRECVSSQLLLTRRNA
jgi:hypothetical protein